MRLLAAIPLFLMCTALAGFYAAAVAGLTALGRRLDEREHPPSPQALAAFILRDTTAAITAWFAGALWAGVGAALALGSSARNWTGLSGALAAVVAQIAAAAAI